jgi:hypothetical protein
MLLDMNGGVCEVVTGVSIGKYSSCFPFFASNVYANIKEKETYITFTNIFIRSAVYPVLASPGYDIK